MAAAGPVSATLAARADAIAARAQADVGPRSAQALAQVRDRLAEPLRVAVVGRVKAGKSTLVNALLGQLVAPTDVSECTQVLTEFRYGYPERAELVLRDGSSAALALERGGRLPSRLGVAPDAVAVLRVWLSNAVLQSMTVIDTPGLNSANAEVSARSEQLLRMDADTRWAAGGADVVLFVGNSALNVDELGLLREHYVTATGAHGSALTALGVLTKADKVGGTGDPWEQATRLARRQSERLRTELAGVLPVLGLLAETAETFTLTEVDAADLAALAELGDTAPPTMLWGADHFLAAELPIPRERRVRLLAVLDSYGIRLGIELAGAGVRGAVALQQALAHRAGLVELRAMLAQTFAPRADALQAYAALNRLSVLSYHGEPADAAALARLRTAIEELRDDPAMHGVAELAALHACLSEPAGLPEELLDDVLRLTRTTAPAARCGLDPDAGAGEIMRTAAAGATAWQSYANSGVGPQAQAVARVIVRTYSLLFEAARQAD